MSCYWKSFEGVDFTCNQIYPNDYTEYVIWSHKQKAPTSTRLLVPTGFFSCPNPSAPRGLLLYLNVSFISQWVHPFHTASSLLGLAFIVCTLLISPIQVRKAAQLCNWNSEISRFPDSLGPQHHLACLSFVTSYFSFHSPLFQIHHLFQIYSFPTYFYSPVFLLSSDNLLSLLRARGGQKYETI